MHARMRVARERARRAAGSGSGQGGNQGRWSMNSGRGAAAPRQSHWGHCMCTAWRAHTSSDSARERLCVTLSARAAAHHVRSLLTEGGRRLTATTPKPRRRAPHPARYSHLPRCHHSSFTAGACGGSHRDAGCCARLSWTLPARGKGRRIRYARPEVARARLGADRGVHAHGGEGMQRTVPRWKRNGGGMARGEKRRDV